MKRLWMITAALALAACSLTTEADRISAQLPKLSAEQLLAAGETRMGAKDYSHARQYFKFLAENFPNSPQAVRALLRLAESYDAQGGLDNWMEARQRFADFFSRFPQAPESEYALYKGGELAMEMRERPALEPLNTKAALQAYNRYLQIYPEGAHAAQARQGIRICRNQLAAHELEVAQFYFKRKGNRAALGRLDYLKNTYPDFDRMREVFAFLSKIYQALGDQDTARRYAQQAEENPPPPTNP
jgi:outer membrane protein assembly factor BamD